MKRHKAQACDLLPDQYLTAAHNLWQQLPAAWHPIAQPFIDDPIATHISQHLQTAIASGLKILPADPFRALRLVAPANVRVVIVGQDPYHQAQWVNGTALAQANGLAFSVPEGLDIPPSLRNIYREINESCGVEMPTHGNLSHWAQQGVLLINATLTVPFGQPGAHAQLGWDKFLHHIIKYFNREHTNPIIWILWGSHAGQLAQRIDQTKHVCLTSPHPSPLSAYRGFFGCGHFRWINEYCRRIGSPPFEWSDHSTSPPVTRNRLSL